MITLSHPLAHHVQRPSNAGGLMAKPDWTDFGPAISVGGHRTLSVIGTS